jgi:hypothetical protein
MLSKYWKHNPTLMAKEKIINYSEYILSGIVYAVIFVFFAFYYNSHLHFNEQFQLFLLTGDFFIEKLSFPGGFSGYVGGFLTQFYYLSLVGPIIITGLLWIMQLVMKRMLIYINNSPVLVPVSFIPSLLAGIIICNEYYPLSAVTGFLFSMISGLIYLKIANGKSRFIAGLILIPVTYWLAGGSYASLLLIILAYELLLFSRKIKKIKRETTVKSNLEERKRDPVLFNYWYLIIFLLIAALIPLIVNQYVILQPVALSYMSEFYYNIPESVPKPILALFSLPAVLMVLAGIFSLRTKSALLTLGVQMIAIIIFVWSGFKIFVNFKAEETMKYDYLVRNERWNDVLDFAEKKPPRNYLSLAMINLSLAKKGQLGNRMFNYGQHGIDGLFLPFEREYVSAIMGNEIFYHLGLTNASQQYAFESMETIPNLNKSVRVLKRLAETNLINAQYGVAEKYLELLDKTLFYSKWAKDARTYLGNEDKINNNYEWGEKRKFAVKNDYFFHVGNIEAVLTRMVKEHPDNKMAFEYLMAYYLIKKDLGNFVNYIPVMEKIQYKEIPVAYQEALLYVISLNNQDPFTNSPYYISRDTKLRMSAYAEIYSKYPDAMERLSERFSDTYWFYFHFIEVEYNPVEEKKDNTGST